MQMSLLDLHDDDREQLFIDSTNSTNKIVLCYLATNMFLFCFGLILLEY